MPVKHQSSCYRKLDGKHYTNFADLCMSDEENNEIIREAKSKFYYVRRIKHPSGYYQLFVSNARQPTVLVNGEPIEVNKHYKL